MPFTHDQKVKLKDRIENVKNKKFHHKIFDIIYAENKDINQNSNCTFMYFHNLKDATYTLLENELKNIKKKKPKKFALEKYVPYSSEDFPSQVGIAPKLKYSNREKNLIKKKRYNKNINKDKVKNVIYKEFDISTLSDSITQNKLINTD